MSAVSCRDGRVYVAAPAVQRLVTEVFAHAGCRDDEADRVGRRLTGANLRGHDSHGVIRTPRYVEWLHDGLLHANQVVRVERENEIMAVLDGGYGLGQSVGEQAVDLGVAKAGARGCAVIALRNAGHLGRIGDWAERAAESGLISIHMVNVRGSLLVAPFGGVDRRGSTSPFCAGIPMPGEEPIVLDFATSQVAEGKALVALRGGAPLPEGSLILPDGTLTADPAPLYGELTPGENPNPTRGPGALTGFGQHKGSGLNFLMEVMGGALTGTGTSNEPSSGRRADGKRQVCNGMLSVYLSVDFFQASDAFGDEVRGYVDFVKGSRPAEPGGEVLIPGEKERRTMAERLQSGLPLPEQTWSDILRVARRVGMDDADIERALGTD
jgi:uncharacterized oxidoreductase